MSKGEAGRVGRAKRLMIIRALCTAGLLVACSGDRIVSPARPLNSVTTAAQGPVDIPFIVRYQVEISASGTFRPGEPITVSPDAVGALDTKDAAFTISAPEIEAMRLAGGAG